MVMTATVTDCPTALPTEERMFDTAGRSIAVDAEYRDGATLDGVLAGAVTPEHHRGIATKFLERHGAGL